MILSSQGLFTLSTFDSRLMEIGIDSYPSMLDNIILPSKRLFIFQVMAYRNIKSCLLKINAIPVNWVGRNLGIWYLGH